MNLKKTVIKCKRYKRFNNKKFINKNEIRKKE